MSRRCPRATRRSSRSPRRSAAARVGVATVALAAAVALGCGGSQASVEPSSQPASAPSTPLATATPVREAQVGIGPEQPLCVTTDQQRASLARRLQQPPATPGGGEPVSMVALPEPVASSLGGLPDAEAFTRAATETGRRDAWPTPAAASLLTEGRPVLIDCPIGDDRPSDFTRGCMLQRRCSLLLPDAGGAYREIRSLNELRDELGPIDSASKALGFVSLVVRDVFLPLSPSERADAEAASEFFAWQAYPEAPTAVEVEELDGGWLVRVPYRPLCGCHHHLVRRAYRVTTDGEVCPVVEEPAPLAYAHQAVCID